MARYEHLPVYKAAMDMTIYFHAQAHKLEQGLCAMLEKEGLEKVFQ